MENSSKEFATVGCLPIDGDSLNNKTYAKFTIK